MKKIYCILVFVFFFALTSFAQVGINNDGTQPDPSAMLDVKSPAKGLLPPRVALSATNVAMPVASPAIGLQVYNTATAGVSPYSVTPGIYSWEGTQWVAGDAPRGANVGDMQFWNGTQWVIVPAGTYGQQLFFCNGVPTWGGCPPMLTTAPITNITYNSAVSGGNITLDGGSDIVARGVCWSTIPNPTINDNKTLDGSGTGSFVSNISGLSANSIYYLRSYATNGSGTGYGNELSYTTLCEFYFSVSVSISASTNPVCSGASVTFTATPVNGGTAPTYQWKKNGTNISGATNVTYTYVPANNDVISCLLTSSLLCKSGSPATSNSITMTITQPVMVSLAISAASNPVCAGTSVTFTATPVNGGTSPAYQWKKNSTSVSGATNSTYTIIPVNFDTIVCVLTSSYSCTLGSQAISNAVVLSVFSTPLSPTSATHLSTQNQIVWNWNQVIGAAGYKWSATNNYANATDLGTLTTKTETGLTCNASYTRYVWAYNTCDNSLPGELTKTTSPCSNTCGLPITDIRDGKVYNTALIGTQCWMSQNLNIGTKVNVSVTQTSNGTIEKYCYDDLESNCDIYGGMYSWGELMNYASSSTGNPSGRQGICPSGWHVPSDAEWCQLEVFLDATVVCSTPSGFSGTNGGGKMKEIGTTHWQSPNTGATNTSGFTALPGGDALNYPGFNLFESLSQEAVFWTSTESSATSAWYVGLYYNEARLYRYNMTKQVFGISGRCLKDTSCTSTPNPPSSGTHSSSGTQIIWNWSTVIGATGYKWNTTNNYESASDMGALTSKTETGLNCNTAYTRYAWSYNTCGNSTPITLTHSTFPNQPVAPTAGTHIPSTNQVVWNWNTVPDVTGYKWSTTNNYNDATDMGTSTTKTEMGLTCGTAYTRYVWAYNTCGNSTPGTLNQTTSACTGAPCTGTPTVSYGGQTYNTVQIGSQCWFKENLNIGTKINGSGNQTNNSIIEKYCYDDLESNCNIYGGLYQWWELMNYINVQGGQGICPAGWHLPSSWEWCQMEFYLDPTVNCSGTGYKGTDVGGKMKETGFIHWESPNTGATNSSGFTALGASICVPGSPLPFNGLTVNGLFWTSSSYSVNYSSSSRGLYSYSEQIYHGTPLITNGYSGRCMKD